MDTAIWIDFLDHGGRTLQALLDRRQVLMHPFVVGEIAMGNLRNRSLVTGLLTRFPQAPIVDDDAVLSFVESNGVFGRGIGYIDAHLLVSVQRTPDTKLWTYDKRLSAIASDLHLGIDP